MPEAVTGKIKRKFMAHYIDSVAPGAGSEAAKYVRLGKDLEEFNVEMNANVETKNNILGETSVNLDSYQPQASAEPYYAEIGDPLFERLQAIIDKRQTLDDLKTPWWKCIFGTRMSQRLAPMWHIKKMPL